MSHKTKAAMQGRQCHYQKLKQSQDTRVNAGGQSLSAPVIAGTAPLARFTPVLAFTPGRGTALQHTQFPEFSVATISQIVGCILNTRQYFPQWGECEPVAHTLFLRTSLGCVQILPLRSPVLGRSNIGYQPFGSMPRDCSSFLRIRFIQVASDESPSLRISSSSCARNSSFNRIGNCGERFSGIDMVYAIGDIVRVYTSVYANDMKAQRPVVLGTHTGRLTTNR
ncbi:hypothetical protein ACTM4R_07595 [Citrobacter freundii]